MRRYDKFVDICLQPPGCFEEQKESWKQYDWLNEWEHICIYFSIIKSLLCKDKFYSLLLCHFSEPVLSVDVKARAVDEMMERIKKGIVLKPTQKPLQVNNFRATVLCLISSSNLNAVKFLFNIYVVFLQTGLDEDSWKVYVYWILTHRHMYKTHTVHVNVNGTFSKSSLQVRYVTK